MDDVNIHIDELILDGDGRYWISSAGERLRPAVPGPQARQIAASVDQAIATAIGAATEPGTTRFGPTPL